MEPKGSSPERMPNISPDAGEFSVPMPEHSRDNNEREVSPEQRAEREGERHHATTTTGPVPVALPTPVAPTASDSTQPSTSDNDVPLSANDDDLIEKEWVDKAKKIVAETRDDPHMREKQVGKLQADYLRKRYGKELGEPAE